MNVFRGKQFFNIQFANMSSALTELSQLILIAKFH